MALSLPGFRGLGGGRGASGGRRSSARRASALDYAVGFALIGSTLAAILPTFAREVHASRLVEPVSGLARMGAAAVSYADGRSTAEAFPPSASLTPAAPPRGRCEADSPELWDHPTWRALDFTPAEPGAPHCFAFGFESTLSATKSTFRAHAHGDLDGDGLTSTFEVRGHAGRDAASAGLEPGMYVEAEVE